MLRVLMSEFTLPAPQLSDVPFRLLIEGVREYAIYMLDPHGHVLTWNPGAERLKGYNESEIIGEHFSRFFMPEDVENGMPQQILAEATKRGAHQGEGWRRRKDGTQFWANVLVTALYSPTGSLRGFAKVTRDQTEQHCMQERLRASEERFRLLVGGLKEHALYMLDPDGLVVNWNTGAEHIKQYRADEIVGRHFGVFFTPDDRASGKPQHELELAAKSGVYEEEGWRVRKDGTCFWASVVVTVLRDESGTIKGYAKVTRDESRRHQAGVDLQQALDRAIEAERTVREHAAELEVRVEERTKILIEQQESLRVLNGELESFAYVASHDLQEPLRTISMQLDLIKYRNVDKLEAGVRKSIDTAMDGVGRMRSLIDSLLTYSRVDHEPKSFEFTDANRAFSDAMRNLQPTVEKARALVESKSLPSLSISHQQLTQVFQNLVGNGIKYNRNPQPQIDISSAREGDDYVIRVRDNGIGIDEKFLMQIFQPFRRLHDQSEFTGSGVGLAIVKKIVERHGGRIAVESIPGHGSCFSFSLKTG